MIKRKEEELCFSSLVIDMMECGWTVSHMDKAE